MKRSVWMALCLGLMVACNPAAQKENASDVFQQAQTAHAESRFSDAVRLYSRYVSEFADLNEAIRYGDECWSKVLLNWQSWKDCVRVTVPRVRIPPLPPGEGRSNRVWAFLFLKRSDLTPGSIIRCTRKSLLRACTARSSVSVHPSSSASTAHEQ